MGQIRSTAAQSVSPMNEETMNRIEFNCTTGERKVIDLTPEEEADALARTAAQSPPIDFSDVDNVEKALKALGLVCAAWNGKTPAQLKTAFKTAWDSLP